MNTVFDLYASEYDAWFEKNKSIFQSEILALKKLIPEGKKGIEIGTGTGRFSEHLGIKIGLEPSAGMARIAEDRGLTVINGVAENLPFHDQSFDFVLMVTTVCFLKDIPKAFSESHRILKDSGQTIIGIIDRNSSLGMKYESLRPENKFYSDAHFHSASELTDLLKRSGFSKFEYWQTLSKDAKDKIESPQPGYEKGSFVVIKATKDK